MRSFTFRGMDEVWGGGKVGVAGDWKGVETDWHVMRKDCFKVKL